jgi:hypothetical protein
MSGSEDQQDFTVRRRGGPPGEHEAQEKGPWAARAGGGIVPAELGGSDAPDRLHAEDPELGGEALGRTAASDEPATEGGVDPRAGDNADATSLGGTDRHSPGEPDLKDAATAPRQVDISSAEERTAS